MQSILGTTDLLLSYSMSTMRSQKKQKQLSFTDVSGLNNEIKLRQNVSVILTMQLVHIYSHKGLRTRRNKKAEKAQIANTTHTNYK